MSLLDTLTFIDDHADEKALNRIVTAVNTRRKVLAARRAALIDEGDSVRIDGISPKYLAGMTGTVKSIKGKHATVTLDEASTDVLARKGNRRFYVPAGVDTYDLSGIPLSCLHSTGAAATTGLF